MTVFQSFTIRKLLGVVNVREEVKRKILKIFTYIYKIIFVSQ